jgi:hypothetical protein
LFIQELFWTQSAVYFVFLLNCFIVGRPARSDIQARPGQAHPGDIAAGCICAEVSLTNKKMAALSHRHFLFAGGTSRRHLR